MTTTTGDTVTMPDGSLVTADELRRAFPAKYTAGILDAIKAELQQRFLHTARILDPFAGIGGIHQLADRLPCTTVGIELEAECAALHPRTIHGDSRRAASLLGDLRAAAGMGPSDLFDAIVTSPAYGNRFADQYLGSDNEKCRTCDGDGTGCTACAGTGRARSKRAGYAIALRRRLSAGSGAAVAWGDKYRRIHAAVLAAVDDTLATDGWWLVNVSSFIGDDTYRDVMEWWVERIAERARVVRLIAVETPRMGFGQNGDARVPVEHIIVAQKDRR